MPGQDSDRANNLHMDFITASVLIAEKKTPARAATRGAGVSRVGESMHHNPTYSQFLKNKVVIADTLGFNVREMILRDMQHVDPNVGDE